MSASDIKQENSTLRFFYVKNQQFRAMHVDGVIGGITPRGHVHFAVYSERPAIPQSTLHSISDTGTLSEPQSMEGKEGIVRELDADLVLTKQAAVELRDWLNKQLDALEKLESRKV